MPAEIPWPTPTTPDELATWLREVVGVDVPRVALLPGHSGPFGYLCHSFFDPGSPDDGSAVRDCVVWANRGGGKTFYGALATLLDLVFKPGIEIRILGGSQDQSRRMMEYLAGFFDGEKAADLRRMLRGKITATKLTLKTCSAVKILAQSQTSVRGVRVQILRCDETDMFKQDVWQAAQFVTRSKQCGPFFVAGRIEALSTMQNPQGLMHQIVRGAAAGTRKLYKWGVLDVLQTCPEASPCPPCPLLEECQGRAKSIPPPGGHFRIADACKQKGRSSAADWAAEMLCTKPRRSAAVLPDFDQDVHVGPFAIAGKWIQRNGQPVDALSAWLCGMDFGIRGSGVILWAALGKGGGLFVLDESIVAGMTINQQAELINAGNPGEDHEAWPVPQWVGCDPAGNNQDHHGKTCVNTLRNAGLSVRFARGALQEGLEQIRAMLRPADGSPPRLYMHPRCRQLIEAATRYHYPPDKPESVVPVKDGFDHPIDALRYLVRGINSGATNKALRYTG